VVTNQPQSIKNQMADKMCDELPQNISKPLLNFDKKWRSGGGSVRQNNFRPRPAMSAKSLPYSI
jgi:hypothetical protein